MDIESKVGSIVCHTIELKDMRITIILKFLVKITIYEIRDYTLRRLLSNRISNSVSHEAWSKPWLDQRYGMDVAIIEVKCFGLRGFSHKNFLALVGA